MTTYQVPDQRIAQQSMKNGMNLNSGGLKIMFDKPLPAFNLDNSGSVSSRAVRNLKPAEPQQVLQAKLAIIDEPNSCDEEIIMPPPAPKLRPIRAMPEQ